MSDHTERDELVKRLESLRQYMGMKGSVVRDKNEEALDAAIAAALTAQPAEPVAWTDEDQPLPEDAEIDAHHPMANGNHKSYDEALRLVGAKRSKGALVELVNWLLQRTAPPSGVAEGMLKMKRIICEAIIETQTSEHGNMLVCEVVALLKIINERAEAITSAAKCDTRDCQEYVDAACPGNLGGPCRMDAALAAPTVADNGWIPVSERLPTEKDGDAHGFVLQHYEGIEFCHTAHWTSVVAATKEDDPFTKHVWQPLPPLPEGADHD